MTIFELVSKDWRKIPQNFRFFILSGVLFVVIVLATDHWGSAPGYNYLGLGRHTFFNFGIALLLIGTIAVLIKQVILAWQIIKLRRKYPISERNKKFYLVYFGDPLYLFDKKDKLAYHIHPLETARDLSLNLYGYSAGMSFDAARSNNLEIGKKGDKIHFKVNDYEFAGQINTRR